MKWLGKAEGFLARIEKAIIVLALAAMFAAGIAQVVIRMAKFGSIGTDEIAMVASSLLIFIGAGLAVYTHDHITIELVALLRKKGPRLLLEAASDIALCVFGVVFTYYSFLYARSLLLSGEQTLQLGIPMALPVSSMVAGGILISIHSIFRLARTAKKLASKEEAVPTSPASAGIVAEAHTEHPGVGN